MRVLTTANGGDQRHADAQHGKRSGFRHSGGGNGEAGKGGVHCGVEGGDWRSFAELSLPGEEIRAVNELIAVGVARLRPVRPAGRRAKSAGPLGEIARVNGVVFIEVGEGRLPGYGT